MTGLLPVALALTISAAPAVPLPCCAGQAGEPAPAVAAAAPSPCAGPTAPARSSAAVRVPQRFAGASELGPPGRTRAADVSACRGRLPVAASRTLTAPITDPDRWVAEDKWKHFFMSFAATMLAYGTLRTMGVDDAVALPGAAAAAGAAGLWKERRDQRLTGHFSVRDLVWDAAGIGVGVGVASQTR